MSKEKSSNIFASREYSYQSKKVYLHVFSPEWDDEIGTYTCKAELVGLSQKLEVEQGGVDELQALLGTLEATGEKLRELLPEISWEFADHPHNLGFPPIVSLGLGYPFAERLRGEISKAVELEVKRLSKQSKF